MTRRVIVIVGGGLAGLRAAERLRERGFDGFITMIGDELVAPYNRPPLSKQLLTGKMRQEELGFQTFTRLAVSLRSGQRAARLDPVGQCVQLESGEEVPYDGLIVATGVSARVLPDMPLHDDRISVLRTLADFRRLERVVRDARSLAVVGGGFVGCEVAASARRRSVGVTIIDRAPALLHRVLGPHVGASLTQVHRQAGSIYGSAPGSTDGAPVAPAYRWSFPTAPRCALTPCWSRWVPSQSSTGSPTAAQRYLTACCATRPVTSAEWSTSSPPETWLVGPTCDSVMNHVESSTGSMRSNTDGPRPTACSTAAPEPDHSLRCPDSGRNSMGSRSNRSACRRSPTTSNWSRETSSSTRSRWPANETGVSSPPKASTALERCCSSLTRWRPRTPYRPRTRQSSGSAKH